MRTGLVGEHYTFSTCATGKQIRKAERSTLLPVIKTKESTINGNDCLTIEPIRAKTILGLGSGNAIQFTTHNQQ